MTKRVVTLLADREECPKSELHTPGAPEGYMARIDWARGMMRKHKQLKCPGCGRWMIWVPK